MRAEIISSSEKGNKATAKIEVVASSKPILHKIIKILNSSVDEDWSDFELVIKKRLKNRDDKDLTIVEDTYSPSSPYMEGIDTVEF